MLLDDDKHGWVEWLHASSRAAPAGQQRAGTFVLPETLQPPKQGRPANRERVHGCTDLRVARSIGQF
ncbi:hypothetical protein [Sinorhizobium medicae]|uniref:hypothetical protein n=1 Tax=Sinorhizobium medicae TaxID=110321 RepID=UPI002B25BA52|nr:hypothetical protein [Sinorhizobium medicae]